MSVASRRPAENFSVEQKILYIGSAFGQHTPSAGNSGSGEKGRAPVCLLPLGRGLVRYIYIYKAPGFGFKLSSTSTSGMFLGSRPIRRSTGRGLKTVPRIRYRYSRDVHPSHEGLGSLPKKPSARGW